MRGDVAFSFTEIAAISNKFGISLDSLVGESAAKSRPYQLSLVEYVDPIEDDFKMWRIYNERLHSVRNDLSSCSVECMNVLPATFLLDYDYITRFYLCKWYNQYGDSDKAVHFRDIETSAETTGSTAGDGCGVEVYQEDFLYYGSADFPVYRE